MAQYGIYVVDKGGCAVARAYKWSKIDKDRYVQQLLKAVKKRDIEFFFMASFWKTIFMSLDKGNEFKIIVEWHWKGELKREIYKLH